MPHKFYHGKSGRVWNVTKRAVGVEMLKQVRRWEAGRDVPGGVRQRLDSVLLPLFFFQHFPSSILTATRAPSGRIPLHTSCPTLVHAVLRTLRTYPHTHVCRR